MAAGTSVLGTALTDKSGQFSSLPLLPAVKAYTFRVPVLGVTLSGELNLWIDGPSVQGYLRTLAANGALWAAPPSTTCYSGTHPDLQVRRGS